jgi:hypothetical protein
VTGRIRPADRAAWQRWATDEFSADEKSVALGTETVLNALIAGYDPVQAQDFARQAVGASHHRAGVGGLVGGLFRAIFHLLGIALRLAVFLLILGMFAAIAYFGFLFFTSPHLLPTS